MCSDLESKPQPCGVRDDAPINCATWPVCPSFFNFYCYPFPLEQKLCFLFLQVESLPEALVIVASPGPLAALTTLPGIRLLRKYRRDVFTKIDV